MKHKIICGEATAELKKLPEKYKQYFRKKNNNETLIFHPTVKPEKLLEYLVRLVTPPNGTVLDLFAGTGTTLVSAEREGFNSINIDSNLEYCHIAYRRAREEMRQLRIDNQAIVEKVNF